MKKKTKTEKFPYWEKYDFKGNKSKKYKDFLKTLKFKKTQEVNQ